jgi:serine protease Do
MRKRTFLASAALVTIGIIFGVVLVSAVGNSLGVQQSFAKGSGSPVTLGGNAPKINGGGDVKLINGMFSSVSKAVLPSVVNIRVVEKVSGGGGRSTSPHNFFFRFFGPEGQGRDGQDPGAEDQGGPMPDQERGGAGSGVIISGDGYIITNNHVVENATSVKVYTFDRHTYDAKVVGTDPSTDLAIVKIEATGLTPASFGNSDAIEVGNWVVAVGNPFELRSTVTAGIISAKARPLPLMDQNRSKTKNYPISDFLQTDAAINPGNSGGGLFDLDGLLVGINSAIATTDQAYQGYGFAVPVNIAKTVAEDIIRHGKVNRGYIGVTIGEVDDAMAEALGLDHAHGVAVNEARKGSAGERAGIRTGDVILNIDGSEVNTPSEIQGIVAQHRAGEKIILHVWRDRKQIDVPVILKAVDEKENIASADDGGAADVTKDVDPGKSAATIDRLGFSVKNADEKTRSDMDIEAGVRVTSVKDYSDAANKGLRVGDVIWKIDNSVVTSAGLVEKLVKGKKGGETLLLVVKSGASDGVSTRLIALRIASGSADKE